MQIALEPRARKFWLLAISMLVATIYMALVTREFVAAHLASRPALVSRQRAAKLEAGNADYRHALGSFFALVDPSAAVEQYKTAVQLNPHAARYWLDLAAAYQVLNNSEAQKQALDRAIQADPTTPDVAWEAANLSLVQGDTERALREFRVVLQNDPHLRLAALQRCWVASPDVDTLLQRVVPAQVEAYLAFLNLLMAKKETVGTVKVWSVLMQLHQHFESRSAIDYIKYLILQREVELARSVWQQAADLLGLSAYLPSAKNLIVNGTFSLDVLNGGFDWQYRKQPSVTLTLDPSDFHGGHRSLSIVFDGPGVSDAGIYQLISVQPNTSYEFAGYFKAGEIEGAGGPRFAIQDLYSEKMYLESDELKNAGFWKPVIGEFTTGPETNLLVLRVARVPTGSPIRGKLWIDDFHLSQK